MGVVWREIEGFVWRSGLLLRDREAYAITQAQGLPYIVNFMKQHGWGGEMNDFCQTFSRIALPALIACLSACRPSVKTVYVPVDKTLPEGTSDDQEIAFVKQVQGTPLYLPVRYPSCPNGFALPELNQQAVVSVWYGFQDLDESFLSTINRVIDPERLAYESSEKTNMRYEITQNRRELPACFAYAPRQSIDTIAQSARRDVEAAASFYRELLKKSPGLSLAPLPKLGLGLLPIYQSDTKMLSQTIKPDGSKTEKSSQVFTTKTDNAFYSPFADDSLSPELFAISIIPQSIEARDQGLFDGRGLWEYPVVLHHEYGHHVFQSLFGEATVLNIKNYYQYWQKHPGLHAIHKSLEPKKLYDNRQREEERAFLASPGYLFGALNEGFADLYAYYSLGAKGKAFDFTCFRKSREVEDPQFYGGINKSWNEAIWQETFSISSRLGLESANKSKNLSPIEECSIPSFDDIHIVGAVIAHSVDQLFQLAVQDSEERKALQKARLLMEWMQVLKASDEVLELSNKQSLSRILNSAFQVTLPKLAESTTPALCRVLQDKFPVLAKRWQEKPAEDLAGVTQKCS